MNATVAKLSRCHVMRNTVSLSGEYGYDKIVSWCVELANEQMISEVKGGDLVILDDSWFVMASGKLRKLFEELDASSVPAVLFLTKSKISGNILECLKELAQQHDMAVFNGNKEKNARYYEKEINKEICYLENSVLMSESLLTDFLFKDRQKLICAMERLENCDIDSLACYEVAVVKVVGEHSDISLEYQYRLLKEEMKSRYNGNILTKIWEDIFIIAFQTTKANIVSESVAQALDDCIRQVFHEKLSVQVRATMGRSYQPISAVRKSFDEALFTMDMYDLAEKQKTQFVKDYNHVGTYRLLRNIHDPAEFQKFYSDYLGSLQAYDMENNSNLVGTLQTYICNDCNLIKTSNELFLHKNTLRYRLQRIEEILQMDLKDTEHVFLLYLCFKIQEYMGITKQMSESSEHYK